MSLQTQAPPYSLALPAKNKSFSDAHLTLQELIERSADPPQVAHNLDELADRQPEFLSELQHDPERLQWFITLFGLSRSLSQELLRLPAWPDTFGDLRPSFSDAEMADRLHEFLETRTPRSTALDLALFRRHEMTRIVLRDALGFATLAETTYQLSNLADAILSFALSDVLASITERHGTPIDASSNPARPARFTVIALGKLGGQELNYSSDIDLMVL